jgi:[1-hydroxy-2-(trimethylamino)ethyl]phosphonate dioxygenase
MPQLQSPAFDPLEQDLPLDPALRPLVEQLRRGLTRRYPGEPVTHWEHALQTAGLAVQSGASPALTTAALLHDIGHLEDDICDTAPSTHGVDDRHEARGALWLARWFGPEVTEPVRLHVEAKRYLVVSSEAYAHKLSADSLRSLALQGGPMRADECADFISRPHAADALRLRCWDDLAKDAGAPPQRLARFLTALQAARRAAP